MRWWQIAIWVGGFYLVVWFMRAVYLDDTRSAGTGTCVARAAWWPIDAGAALWREFGNAIRGQGP